MYIDERNTDVNWIQVAQEKAVGGGAFWERYDKPLDFINEEIFLPAEY
jgi:hypothetical protein